MDNGLRGCVVLARQLERCQLAPDVAVCGSLLWMVAVLDVPNCLNGSRAMVQWNGRRGALLSRGSAFAIGTCQVVTIPARSELERPRDASFEAVCACLHLTFGSARLSWSGQWVCRIRCGVDLQYFIGSSSGYKRPCPDAKILS